MYHENIPVFVTHDVEVSAFVIRAASPSVPFRAR